MIPLTQQLEDKKKELIILNECCSQDKNNTEGILRAEIAILEQAIAEINELKQMYKVRNDDSKDYAKVITELQTEMQNQRQEILDKIIEVKKEILLQRRYLPSKEYVGTMNYWVGDNNENRGIYVDLGGIIGKIDDFIEQLNQPKTEKENSKQ